MVSSINAMTTSQSNTARIVKRPIVADCPSCHQRGYFLHAGDQHWPQRVAEKLGIAPCVSLWECTHCHSTFTDPDLV